MSFQAYLDAAEAKTGLTPQEIVHRAHAQGFDVTTRTHRDESATLRLDGVAAREPS